MTKYKPKDHQKPNFNARKDSGIDNRLSTCQYCRRGIFKGRNDYTYTNTGYVHTKCMEDNETEDAA